MQHALPKCSLRRWLTILAAMVLGAACLPVSAQLLYDRHSNGGEGWYPGVNSAKSVREAPFDLPLPAWTNAPPFDLDVFTFARVRYTRQLRFRGQWNGGYWYTDTPDSELNLSYRLHQMTSLRVHPDGRIIDLTDPEMFNYPFIYMVEPGLLIFEEEEVPILRRYLLNGGFLMADDFWGTPQWDNFERQMKRVFPEYQWVELDMSHPIFHTVFDLKREKNSLQVPNVMTGREAGFTGITWEIKNGEECRDVHFRALFDDKGHMIALGCHNTDNGDGWEREGEDEYFFHRFSENIAYPLTINILFYTMTH